MNNELKKKYIYVEDEAKRITTYLSEFANYKEVMTVLKQMHMKDRQFFDVENLEKHGFNHDFLVQVYDCNDPTSVFVPIFCNTARQYGFPANVALIGIASENGLGLDDHIKKALMALTVPTEV